MRKQDGSREKVRDIVNHPRRTANSGTAPGLGPWVVGTVYSGASLAAAGGLSQATVGHGLTKSLAGPDFLELRVDHFARRPARLDPLAARPPRPLLVTVRHPAEGGAAAGLDAPARRLLYERFLPVAAWVDVEVRSLRTLAATVAGAKASGVCVVASFHDFHAVPGATRLRDLAARAMDAGADVFKVAVTVRGPGDLARLLDLMEQERRLPLAVMGMGPLGRVSRLALAASGSVFNYGYLGKRPQVPGQWPAATLRERIDELLAERTARPINCPPRVP